MQQIRAFEERAFNAWPARQTLLCNGWLLRLSGGFTKRANSANAAEPGASFDGIRAAAEAFYGRHGLPAVFRLSPLAPPEADRELAAAGYVFFDPTRVARASLAAAASSPNVDIAAQPSSDWLHGFAEANAVDPRQRELHHAMVRALALPSAFATLRERGRAVGFGLAVLERGAVGCYDIVVDPARRRRGHARTLTRALLDWGREEGAELAYLQVREQNAPARRLYAGLGFEDFYRYHYRVPGSGTLPIAATAWISTR
jgi:ribosomal protein S18 acetylase RimI-like enzyme